MAVISHRRIHMTVIHKQQLSLTERQSFRPIGDVIKVLTVQVQNNVPCFWYEIDPDFGPSGDCEIEVMCVGTGNECPGVSWSYRATTQLGAFVFHWYVRITRGVTGSRNA
jgi:hypothetical protein